MHPLLFNQQPEPVCTLLTHHQLLLPSLLFVRAKLTQSHTPYRLISYRTYLHPYPHTHTHTHTLSLSLSRTTAPAPTHTHTHTLSLSHQARAEPIPPSLTSPLCTSSVPFGNTDTHWTRTPLELTGRLTIYLSVGLSIWIAYLF